MPKKTQERFCETKSKLIEIMYKY